jgi:hypothetical protein
MTENDKQKPTWDQTEFEKFRASWSPARAAADAALLADIFRLAEKSPLVAEELAWAKENGVQFFIDHNLPADVGGYYMPGMGVLAIGAKALEDPVKAVTAIAHELRHAWQDAQGLFNTFSYNYTEHALKNALIEADAQAFGWRAEDQFNGVAIADEAAGLREKFLMWFKSEAPQKYGVADVQSYLQNYGLATTISIAQLETGAPATGDEFNAAAEPLGEGVDITNMNDVAKLGATFLGAANYMADLPPKTLSDLLRPELADTFWGAANDEERKKTAQLQKAYLKIMSSKGPQP